MAAVAAGEPGPAVALVRPRGVSTDAVVAEGLVVGAFVDVQVAGCAVPPLGAVALEPVGLVYTGGAIQTRAREENSTVSGSKKQQIPMMELLYLNCQQD